MPATVHLGSVLRRPVSPVFLLLLLLLLPHLATPGLDAPSPSATAEESAIRTYHVAQAHLTAGRHAEALALFLQLHALLPGQLEFLDGVCTCHLALRAVVPAVLAVQTFAAAAQGAMLEGRLGEGTRGMARVDTLGVGVFLLVRALEEQADEAGGGAEAEAEAAKAGGYRSGGVASSMVPTRDNPNKYAGSSKVLGARSNHLFLAGVVMADGHNPRSGWARRALMAGHVLKVRARVQSKLRESGRGREVGLRRAVTGQGRGEGIAVNSVWIVQCVLVASRVP